MTIDPRNRRFRTIALGAAVLGAAATLGANPAVATGIITAVTMVSCSVTGSNWCISGNNSSSGIGVIGTSKTGTGLRGTSTTQNGLKATSGSGTAILAQSATGQYGVNASAPNGYAVSGSGTVGVSGTSTKLAGIGVLAESDLGYPLIAYGHSNAPAIMAQQDNPDGDAADFRSAGSGVASSTPAGTFSFLATDNNNTTEFFVDGQGDVAYHGSLIHLDIVGTGATLKSFTTNATQPTLEDTGTAQLAGGAAAIPLDRTFAASIEPRSYRVFVTPNGDTNGLFVALKTAKGFIVRESRGGRSTVSFDYRIVGTARGKSGEHMAFLKEAAGRFLPHFPAPALPVTNRPPAIKAPGPEPASP